MKLRAWLVLGSSVSLVTAVVIACGGTSDDGGSKPTTDSGAPDTSVVDTGAPQDASKADVVDTGTCDTSKSFLDTIPADASLDDAGRTAGECTACLKAKCASEVSACNADCDCQGAAGDSEIMPSASIDASGRIAVSWYDNRRRLTVAGEPVVTVGIRGR